MNTSQIQHVLKNDVNGVSEIFKGVFPCDRLPKKITQFPCAIVANTDYAGEPGKHWVCFYFDKDGNMEYFDSYGIRPINCPLYEFFSTQGKTCTWNKAQLQGWKSTVCGQWCIAFLTNRARNQSMDTFIKRFEEGRPGRNDAFIGKTVNDAFEIHKLKTVKQTGGGLQNCCSRFNAKT